MKDFLKLINVFVFKINKVLESLKGLVRFIFLDIYISRIRVLIFWVKKYKVFFLKFCVFLFEL